MSSLNRNSSGISKAAWDKLMELVARTNFVFDNVVKEIT
jgi:hypothetical protein